MGNIQKKMLQKGESMLLDLIKKGFGLLKAALEKFKVQNEEILYITAKADDIFSLYMENGLYDKIDRICEDGFFDSVVEYSLNSAEYNIDDYINSLLDEKTNIEDDDKKVVISFFHKIRDIIIEAQIIYGITDPEHKLLSKEIQEIKESISSINLNDGIEQETTCLIGILACDVNDPRTRELLELPIDCLLNLTDYINSLDDVQKIRKALKVLKMD